MMKILIVGCSIGLMGKAQKILENLLGIKDKVDTVSDVIVDDSGTEILPVMSNRTSVYSKIFNEDTSSHYDYSLIPCYQDYDYPEFEYTSYPKPKSAPKPKETFHHKYAHLFNLKRQIDCDGDEI